jgi:hypothetical protein
MSNTIRIKRRTAGAATAPESLLNGELAYNEVNDVLYYGRGAGTNGAAINVVPIAGKGAYVPLQASGQVNINHNQTVFENEVAIIGDLIIGQSPTQPEHGASKAYVDSVAQGLVIKDAVRMATTANINLSGLLVVDGINAIAGDRVLVKNQTNASQNGIYIAGTGAWVRASDFTHSENVRGTYVFVQWGITQGATGWSLTNKGVIEVGFTDLSFTQFISAADVSAGAGLTKVGNQLSVADDVVRTGQINTFTTKPNFIGGIAILNASPEAALNLTAAPQENATEYTIQFPRKNGVVKMAGDSINLGSEELVGRIPLANLPTTDIPAQTTPKFLRVASNESSPAYGYITANDLPVIDGGIF